MRVPALVAAVLAVLTMTACGAARAVEGGIPTYSPYPDTLATIFTFKAEDGAHPVDGREGEWTAPASEIMVREYQNVLKIDAADETGFDYIAVELNAPGKALLEVGTYEDARSPDHAPDSPGMLVVAKSLGCGNVYGEFVIDRIERDVAGTLLAVDAGFTQRCDSPDGPALHGRIHFQS